VRIAILSADNHIRLAFVLLKVGISLFPLYSKHANHLSPSLFLRVGTCGRISRRGGEGEIMT
jgi:hypothetical protein